MLNAMLASTKLLVPGDFPAVAQATSGHSVVTFLHTDAARNTIGVYDSLINPQPHPMVAPSIAPTAPVRPPAVLDPVMGVTLPKTRAPYDCIPQHSEMQLANHPDRAVFADAPDHVISSVSTIVTPHHPVGKD